MGQRIPGARAIRSCFRNQQAQSDQRRVPALRARGRRGATVLARERRVVVCGACSMKCPLPLDAPVYATHRTGALVRAMGRRAIAHRSANGTARRIGMKISAIHGAMPRLTVCMATSTSSTGIPVAVSAHPAGDSGYGVSQMIGNGWEWTSTPFKGLKVLRRVPTTPAIRQISLTTSTTCSKVAHPSHRASYCAAHSAIGSARTIRTCIRRSDWCGRPTKLRGRSRWYVHLTHSA